MCRITDAFIKLLGVNDTDMQEWQPAEAAHLAEITQLRLPLDQFGIL